MRLLDELLHRFGDQDETGKRFILTRLEDHAREFDSPDALDLYLREIRTGESAVSHQAAFSLLRFLPGHVAHRFGVTACGSSTAAEASAEGGEAQRVFLEVTEPLVQALLEGSRDESRGVRQSCRLALTQYPTRSVIAELTALVDADPGAFEAALGLAHVQRGAGGSLDLFRIIKQHVGQEPDLALLLMCRPHELARGAFRDLAMSTDTLGRIGLAQALVGVRDEGWIPLARDLLQYDEPPVQAQVLLALQRLGATGLMSEVAQLLARSEDPEVRLQCVRTAGFGEGSRDSVDLCLGALRDPSGEVQAGAIESLMRLGVSGDLRATVLPLTTSPSPRVRVAAILATWENEEGIPQAVSQLLGSAEVFDRLEGVSCLGHIQNSHTVEMLTIIAGRDDSEAVRRQAITSLSRHPLEDTLDRFVGVIRGSRDREALHASRALTRYAGDDAAEVSHQLCRVVRLTRDEGVHERVLPVLGFLAGAGASAEFLDRLGASLDSPSPGISRAAVEAAMLAGGEALRAHRKKIEALGRADDPTTVLACLMASLLAGSIDAIGRWADLLRSGEEAARIPLATMSLQLGCLAREIPGCERYPEFRASMASDPERRNPPSDGAPRPRGRLDSGGRLLEIMDWLERPGSQRETGEEAREKAVET